MKTNSLLAGLSCACALLCAGSLSRAVDITAAGSGNWSSTVPNAPWPGGIVPGTNDDVDVEAPFVVTVDSTASVQFIYGSGSIVLAPNATLTVVGDSSGANGIDGQTTLNATNKGSTVQYVGNPFWAKQCDYYNLVFANTNYVDPIAGYQPYQNFNNFSRFGPIPMHIFGSMTVKGFTKVQQGSGGAPITIDGNLSIGTNCVWDSSGDDLTVASNLFVYGLLEDLNGALGSNYFGGNVAILGAGSNNFTLKDHIGAGWYVSDVITWGIGGNLTNNGAIFGTGYGSIAFEGSDIITGTNPLKLPTLTIDGSYMVGTTIILTTNTPTLNGTILFDLVRTNQLVLLTDAATSLYYSGNLTVVNSGAPVPPGATYTLFNCTNLYGGGFAVTTLPPLRPNLSWVDNTLYGGDIDVTGTLQLPLVLNIAKSGNLLTLSWDSASYPGYSVQGQTNKNGLGTVWSETGSGTVSPYVVAINPTNPPVFFRLHHP